jgi:hypothetical protein
MREGFKCDISYLENTIPIIDQVKLGFGFTEGINEDYVYIYEIIHGEGFGNVDSAEQKEFVVKCLTPFINQLKERILQNGDFLKVEITSIPYIMSTEDEKEESWIFDPTFKSNHHILLEYRAVSRKRKHRAMADIVFNGNFTKVIYNY